MRLSVIIPTFNEALNLPATIASVRKGSRAEILVVDGGSDDETTAVAGSLGARVLSSPRGRARQMNAGARAAEGAMFLFLHADTRLPEGFLETIRRVLSTGGTAAGAFELRIDASLRSLRVIEKLANWRSRTFQLPYGDQGLFLKATVFHEAGGFREMPLMEDFEFVRRLRRHGRVVTVGPPVETSARRWQERGVLRTTVRNQVVILAYHLEEWWRPVTRFMGNP